MKSEGLEDWRVFLVVLVALGGLLLPADAAAQVAAIPSLSSSDGSDTEELDPRVVGAVRGFTEEFVWLEPGQPRGYSAAGVPLYDLNNVQVFRGRQNELLEAEEIYLAVGADELAMEYRRRARSKRVMVITGMSMVLASFTVPTVYVATVNRLNPNVLLGMLVGGLLVGTTGYAVTRVGLMRDPHPVGYSDRYQLIEEHNRRLMEVHDLYMDELPQFEILVPGVFDLNVGIRLGPGGAGVATAGRF